MANDLPTGYVTVIINSPADWPKEDGTYFCCRSGFMTVIDFKTGLPGESWMREVRWYLQPQINNLSLH